MDKPWFKRWFGDHYKRLYPHRDLLQAEGQVGPLLRILPVTSAWRMLDIGCGTGRHLEVLKSLGHAVCLGLDLSFTLLRDARASGLPVARGDMRSLPFRPEAFDLVTCFFTSFGYFATFEEDVDALAQFVSVIKPGGYLFLDLPNRAPLMDNLVAEDSRDAGGYTVRQSRSVEFPAEGPGHLVIKDIEIRGPGGTVERFQERVRFYSLDEMLAMARDAGLERVAAFGDESGGAFHALSSPRMSLVFQKEARPG